MKFLVSEKHNSNYPNPIEFGAGDVLKLGQLDTEYPGWIRVTTKDGNEGWAPISDISVEDSKETGIAINSYCANELNVQPGEELAFIKEKNGWYWCLNQNGDYGWVPKEIGKTT